MFHRITALILAAIFAVPLCCCWGKVEAKEGDSSVAVASCPNCPTAPVRDRKAPADHDQPCKCADKKIASDDGSLTTPRTPELDVIVPPLVETKASVLMGNPKVAIVSVSSAGQHPPGVPVRVAYCVYRL